MSAVTPGIAALTVLASIPATTLANDGYIGYVETLGDRQQRAYRVAAPDGQDQPLSTPADALTVPVQVTVPAEVAESRIESLGQDRSGPLSLNETQQDQVLEESLELFGYDIFQRAPSTFSPVEGMPVPVSYRIGPGDHLVVQLFGKRNVEYNLVVTRDGDILVPEYGPVAVGGLTFDETERLITEGFERRAIGVRAVVTMGQLRTIQIRLTGDVLQPGIYTVGGLSTLVDALLTTGGVRSTGSLRDIQLIRDGRRVARLDLYDLLLVGSSGDDTYLQHNDTIFVPPIGPVVYVGGEVQRPAIYELRGSTTVGEIIDMAGGLLATASLQVSHIERIQTRGYRTLIDFVNAGGDAQVRALPVANGDVLRVLPLEDQLEDVVLLSGQVERPGGYQFREGMRVSDLLVSAAALLPGADVNVYLIQRENPATLRKTTHYRNLLTALEQPGGEHDMILQPRDEVIVFDLAKARADVLADIVRGLELQATATRPAQVVSVRGAVRYEGRLPLETSAGLLEVFALAGGALPGADRHYGVVARTRHPGREIEIHSFSLAAAEVAPRGEANLRVQPGDRLYLFEEGGERNALLEKEIERLRAQALFGEDALVVRTLGEVRVDGVYPLVDGMRASDLLCASGGLTRRAFGLNAELSRIQHDAADDNRTLHLPLDSADLLAICELGKRAAEGAPGAEAFLARYTDDLANPVLNPMDQLSFSEKPGWVEQATVTLEGEIRRPGVYAIDRGESLCQVLQRAGGLTLDAYAFGAEFSRESVRTMQQQTIDELHEQLDDLMVDLSLSHSFNNDEKSSPEWSGKQDYLRAIQQLERAEATGRMVVNLDKVRACKAQDALVLEDGDSLSVPRRPNFVQVAGQVYVPTSHLFSEDRSIKDYIELSGGSTVLGKLKHAYVIQANGEVLNLQGRRVSSRIARKTVQPGSRIYVPLNVDRMNGTEKAQTWVQTLVNSAILAGIVL
ncbi:MAG: polysialic acid transporter [Xanthomonadales bacterium]|nr:polysialic acid transporter [Xanthomonadales bacterium]